MNPEEAKTKITQLLELGTLQGVKVEYEDGKEVFFINHPTNKIVVITNGDQTIYFFGDYFVDYTNIKTIHPIPLQPKLLEVGDRVKIISGVYEGKIGVIVSVVHEPGAGRVPVYHVKGIGQYVATFSIYNVVPESLLVEEEESETIEFKYPDGQIHRFLIKDIEGKLKQAGYQVTKE